MSRAGKNLHEAQQARSGFLTHRREFYPHPFSFLGITDHSTRSHFPVGHFKDQTNHFADRRWFWR